MNNDFRAKVLACWLGKAVGGTLGMPFEGKDGPFDLKFYEPVPTQMLPNDDLDLQVLWACVMRDQQRPAVDRQWMGDGWLKHVDFPWDEYGVCIRNLRNGIRPPASGSYDNWFTRGMGAAIRSELWACLAPGNPALAAAYAYEDACVDHAGEGVWAAMFFAALESAAFEVHDPDALIDAALKTIPAGCEIAQAVEAVRQMIKTNVDWRTVRQKIVEQFGHENFTDVVMNVAFTILGWLAAKGDFSRAICIAVNCGKDTDCTGATAGSLMGILDPGCIGDEWLKPIGRELKINRQITGISHPPTLDEFTDLVLDLHKRLGGRPPEVAKVVPDTRPLGIDAQVAFAEAMPGECPAGPWAMTVRLAGTRALYPADQFERPVMLVRYRFVLEEALKTCVMFNTRTASKVWVDGKYLFGRDGGVMAPSMHRAPQGQKGDVELAAGQHEIVAAVARPADRSAAEWVVGVGRASNRQWLPKAFLSF